MFPCASSPSEHTIVTDIPKKLCFHTIPAANKHCEYSNTPRSHVTQHTQKHPTSRETAAAKRRRPCCGNDGGGGGAGGDGGLGGGGSATAGSAAAGASAGAPEAPAAPAARGSSPSVQGCTAGMSPRRPRGCTRPRQCMPQLLASAVGFESRVAGPGSSPDGRSERRWRHPMASAPQTNSHGTGPGAWLGTMMYTTIPRTSIANHCAVLELP